MSTKSHAHTRCGTLRKSSISTRGYAEIHIQRPFFDNKNSIWNILGLKIQTVETCSTASSIHRIFYFWKTLKSWFLVEFQSFVFKQIWADFGSFGQFWAGSGRNCCIDIAQEVSKTPVILDTYGSLPKIRKGRPQSFRG
jgi:hypothetical protein